MSNCKACGAQLLWATTTASKKIPLDAEPSSEGNITIGTLAGVVGPVALVLGQEAAARAHSVGRTLYRSHFVTCPEAGKFRRKKG